jgi:hypothetical protein
VSLSGDWETFYIEERVPEVDADGASRRRCKEELAAQQKAQREGYEFHMCMLNQNIKPSLSKHWTEVREGGRERERASYVYGK